MPPKPHFTKEQIIEAAFEITRRQGRNNLSARTVAGKLKCSTSPIYSAFQTMQELDDAVCTKSTELMVQYQTRSHTDSPFLDMGLGYILFAQEEQQIFRDMFINKDEFRQHSREMQQYAFAELFEKVMEKDPTLAGLAKSQKIELLQIMWIFTHGIACQVCINAMALKNNLEIIALLKRVMDPLLETIKKEGPARKKAAS